MRIGPTPWVSTSQPASVSMGEPQLPSCTISHDRSGSWTVSWSGQWRRSSENDTSLLSRSDRVSADVAAVDLPREQGEPLAGRRGPGSSARDRNVTEVLRVQQVLFDVHAVERGVGRVVGHFAVVVDEAHEAGVLDTVRLRRGVRPQHPLGQLARSAENSAL